MKLESTETADSKSITQNGKIVAFCEQYTGDKWAVHDMENQQLCDADHDTPEQAMEWFERFMSM